MADHPIPAHVLAEVRAEMARLRMPQYVLAKRMHVSPAWMTRRMLGYVPLSPHDLHAIGRILGRDPEWFYAQAARR